MKAPVLLLLGLAPAPVTAAPLARGVALGLFAEDPGWSYRPLLDEIRRLGADHVEPEEARRRAIPVEELTGKWHQLRVRLEQLARAVGRPLLLTEVGYLSQRGAAAWPWQEGAAEPVDLDEQRRCYQAFRIAWQEPPPTLAGVYFWNWYGWGGASSRGYTPRGKPAAEEIREFFDSLASKVGSRK